jgi:hypothetical protein
MPAVENAVDAHLPVYRPEKRQKCKKLSPNLQMCFFKVGNPIEKKRRRT